MYDRPFHYWLPQWLLSQVAKKECSECGIPYDKSNITACGIKQSDDNRGLFVEHTCNKCEHTERVNFYSESHITLRDICGMLIKEYQSKKQIEVSKNIREPFHGSIISSTEVKNFLKFLEGSVSHEDFMKHIGCKFEEKKKPAKKKVTKKKTSKKKTKDRKPSNKKHES